MRDVTSPASRSGSHAEEPGGSDLYLVAGLPPSIRVDGAVRQLAEPVLDGDDIEENVLPALPAHAVGAVSREGACGRVAAAWQPGTISSQPAPRARPRRREHPRAAVHPPQLGELGLPPSVEALTRLPHGLVLIGGPTGSGKTTTLAALVDVINRRDTRHIVTIEDPIEYEHPTSEASSSRSRSASMRRTFPPPCGRRSASRRT